MYFGEFVRLNWSLSHCGHDRDGSGNGNIETLAFDLFLRSLVTNLKCNFVVVRDTEW